MCVVVKGKNDCGFIFSLHTCNEMRRILIGKLLSRLKIL